MSELPGIVVTVQGAEPPVLEAIDELLAKFRFAPPVVHTLEIGEQALLRLRAAVPDREQPSPLMSPITALTGIPIVVREDMHPLAWRFLDASGVVIREGIWNEDANHADEEAR